jgi:O-antigen ligase
MAYASSVLRPSAQTSAVPVLAVAGLAMLGVVGGVALALGELDALYICLSVIAALGIFYDFRVGAILLTLLLPIEPSSLFPHSLGGVKGLNPMNVLEAATLVSFLLHAKAGEITRLVPPRLFWLYLAPIAVGGVIGAQHVDQIPDVFGDDMAIAFVTDAAGYLRDFLLKPMTIVLVGLLLGAAAARSKKPQQFLIPIIASVWIIALLEIQYVVFSGVGLGQLASADARNFFAGMGMHANELGRVFALAYGLLLFMWAETKSPALKIVLMATMATVALALLLTFSRGAFLGFVIVSLLFVLWKFNSRTMVLALVGALLVSLFLPGAVYDRVMMGFEGGGNVNEVSAGRVDGIWLPLLPELLKSPIWGNGLSSIMWADAMRSGTMLVVGHPHNAFIEAILDLGVVGLGLLLAYYWHVWKGFRALGSNDFLSPELRGLFKGAAAGLIAFLITGMAGSSLRPTPESIYLWLAIGMMYGQFARKPAQS